MMNNFIFAVVLDIYLAQMIDFGNFSLVQLLDLIGFVVLVFVIILKWKDIKEYLDVNRGFHGIAQITFSRVTIILYIIYLVYRTFLPYFAPYLFFR
jgi:protease